MREFFGKDSKTALAQNAFIYAIARTYSKPIKKLYMRATNSPEPMDRQLINTSV
jgi:hypothetical protein